MYRSNNCGCRCAGGDSVIEESDRAFQEGRRLERADIFAAIKGGEGYETIWEREPSDA